MVLLSAGSAALTFDFDINHRWALGTNVEALYLPFGEITGGALRSRIQTRYGLSPHVGLTFGISYFQINVRKETDTLRNELDYGYDGLFTGVSVFFQNRLLRFEMTADGGDPAASAEA